MRVREHGFVLDPQAGQIRHREEPAIVLIGIGPSKAHQLVVLTIVDLRRRSAVDFNAMIELTAAWYKRQFECGDGDMRDFSCGQLAEFERRLNEAIQLDLQPRTS